MSIIFQSIGNWVEFHDEGRDADRPYTVADALADYRADYIRRSGKATDRMDASTDAWIEPELGSIVLDRLTRTRIVAWHQKISETPARLRTKVGKAQRFREAREASPDDIRRRRSTANRVLTILKAALNHAHRENRCVSDDAWRTARAFREVDAARMRYLSDDEVSRLINACAAYFRQLVGLALLTGCRYGELVAMTVDGFSSYAGTLRVRVSKSGKPRHVVLTDEGQEFLRQVVVGRSPTERLFVRESGKPWKKSGQHRPLTVACKVALIDPANHFHALRHSTRPDRLWLVFP